MDALSCFIKRGLYREFTLIHLCVQLWVALYNSWRVQLLQGIWKDNMTHASHDALCLTIQCILKNTHPNNIKTRTIILIFRVNFVSAFTIALNRLCTDLVSVLGCICTRCKFISVFWLHITSSSKKQKIQTSCNSDGEAITTLIIIQQPTSCIHKDAKHKT